MKMLYQTTVQVPELSQYDLIDGGIHRESHTEIDFKLEMETRAQSPVATADTASLTRGAAMTSWRRARLLEESESVPSTHPIRGSGCAHSSAGKTVESLSSAEHIRTGHVTPAARLPAAVSACWWTGRQAQWKSAKCVGGKSQV